MNIKEEKRNILENIELLENDIEILQKNICELKEMLSNIRTEKDAERFDSTFNIEKDLKFIRLF